jgi:TPR repeat protein
MIKTTHIVLLSCLFTGVSAAAMAASNQPAGPGPAPVAAPAAAPAPPTPAQLRAMPTARLLKLGQAALTAPMDTPAFVTGLDAAKTASSRGDREATRLMAKIIARNQIVMGADDRAKLERRFRFEALHGASSSVLAVAMMYDQGEGVAVDKKKAAEWYLWAARVGHEQAMARVAYDYGTGRGLARDEAAAFKWLDGVNEGRQRSTLLDIGWALAQGTEESADMPAALRFFERAAHIKPNEAYKVALDLQRGTRGIQNREAADHLIRVAAQLGDSDAATHLANLLAGSNNLEDQRQAVQWYTLAAQDKTNAAAGQSLSRLLSLRPSGDLVPSIVAGLQKGADAGNTEAMVGLAHAYAEGIGMDAAPERAAHLLQQAADAGVPEAKYRLGLMYKSGAGVGADLNKAIELISSAQDSGFPLAAVALGSLTDPTITSSVPGPENGPAADAGAVAK